MRGCIGCVLKLFLIGLALFASALMLTYIVLTSVRGLV